MIIIINGTSSSGKSSACQALQQRLGEGWLYFGTDGYLSMLGDKFLGLHPDNPEVCTPNDICYAKKHKDGTYEITPGKLCSKLYTTIPDILGIIANQGFNIIVDAFITTQEDFNTYKDKLRKYGTCFVYLHASEEIIAGREEARGDRLKGSAIHWLKSFTCQDDCDLVIDTGDSSIEVICQEVIDCVRA